MAAKIDVAETATSLNQLLCQLEQEGEILLTRQGEPIARILPIPKTKHSLRSRSDLRSAQTKSQASSLDTLQMLRKEARY